MTSRSRVAVRVALLSVWSGLLWAAVLSPVGVGGWAKAGGAAPVVTPPTLRNTHSPKGQLARPPAVSPSASLMPYQPAYRPDNQPESFSTSHDPAVVKPDLWDDLLYRIPGTRTASLNTGPTQRFLLLAPLESRLGERYVVAECVGGGQADMRVVWDTPLVATPGPTQTYELEARTDSSAARLLNTQADAPSTLRLNREDSQRLLDALAEGQTVTLRLLPQPGSAAVGHSGQTLTLLGDSVGEAWNLLNMCE